MLLPTYTGNVSLAERFWDLVNTGVPLAEAPALLFDLYITHHFYTVGVPSEIKAVWLNDDGNLVVELSDGSKPDPATIVTRDPRGPDKTPTPLDTLYQIRKLKQGRQEQEEEWKKLLAATVEVEDSPRIKRLEAARERYEAEEKAEAEARAKAEAEAETLLHQKQPADEAEAEPAPETQIIPLRRKPSRPRHPAWKPIREHFDPNGKTRGRWLNPHTAATEVFKWATDEGLTISFEAIYDGIPNFHPEWLETDSKG